MCFPLALMSFSDFLRHTPAEREGERESERERERERARERERET